MQRRNTNQVTIKVSSPAFQCLLPFWSRRNIVSCQLLQIIWVGYILYWILKLEVILIPLSVCLQKSKSLAIHLCQKQCTRDNTFCWSITQPGQRASKYYKYILEAFPLVYHQSWKVPQVQYLPFTAKPGIVLEK